jgi:predicted DNA binding protein
MWAGVPFVRADETRVMVFGSDVTEQRYRERSYQRLYEGSQALLQANTLAEVTEEIVAIAEDLFEVSYVIAFRFDRSERLLQPVDATGTGSIPLENRLEPVEPGDGIVGETFVESEPRTVETGAVPRGVSNELPDSERIRVVPLSGEGVLVVGFAGRDSFDGDTITIIEGLGNIGAMAMANLRRTSHLQAAEEERDELQRTIQHMTNVTEMFSDLWAAFAKSETRTEIERNTCEVLVNGPAVSGAWFGERNVTTDSIESTVTTGVASSIIDHVDYSLAVDPPTIPAVRAIRESEPVVQRVDETPRGERMNEWARRLQATDVGMVYSTPIRSDDVTYGVVTFFVTRTHPAPRLLDLMADRGGFLGDMVANAITAVERKRSLVSDKRFELTFRVSGPECLFSELADVLEARVTFEKLVQQTGNTTVFVTVDDVDPAAVRALPAEIGPVHEAEVLRERPTGETTARIDITRPFLGTLLPKWGASVSEITTSGSSVRVVATVPKNDLVSLIRTSLRDHFSSAELVSKRRINDSDTTENEREQIGNELTERQLEVLQTAYHAGYFESPRATTGEAVADLLDISPQAFYQHVRKIERKLVESIIESGLDTK